MHIWERHLAQIFLYKAYRKAVDVYSGKSIFAGQEGVPLGLEEGSHWQGGVKLGLKGGVKDLWDYHSMGEQKNTHARH